jgi:hypothetical protein
VSGVRTASIWWPLGTAVRSSILPGRPQNLETDHVCQRGHFVLLPDVLSPRLSARCLPVLCLGAGAPGATASVKIPGIVLALLPQYQHHQWRDSPSDHAHRTGQPSVVPCATNPQGLAGFGGKRKQRMQTTDRRMTRQWWSARHAVALCIAGVGEGHPTL